MSGIILFNRSHNCIIEKNKIVVSQHSNQYAQSGILNYASYDNTIKNNIIIGEFYDGTLSIYGGGTSNVIVDGNIVKNMYDENIIYLSEGITVDASTEYVTVTNNIISDMYYGIDVKHDAKDTLVSNNTLVGNKISIADRPGEENGQTFNTQIKNNQIIIRKDFNTDTLGNALFDGFYYIGVYISSRLSSDIKNNKITCFGSLSDLTLCGIKCSSNPQSTSNQYQSQFDICNNTLEFSTGFGSTTSNAGATSVGIYLENIKKGLISSNSFKVDLPSNRYDMFKLKGDNTNLFITSNLCHTISQDNHYFISTEDNATITNSSIINNKIPLSACRPISNLNDITNLIEDNRFNLIAHRIKTIDITGDTWTTIARIKLRYSGIISFKINSLITASGTKWLKGDYVINIYNTTISPNIISEEKNGFDIQFINTDINNEMVIQIKTPTGVNIPNFSNLFISELMATQTITLLNN